MRRVKRIEFTVTSPERLSIEAKARSCGLPIASLARSALLDLKLPVRKVNIEAEAIAALNRIGSNLNQIARVGNSSGSLSPDQIRALASLHKAAATAVQKIKESMQ